MAKRKGSTKTGGTPAGPPAGQAPRPHPFPPPPSLKKPNKALTLESLPEDVKILIARECQRVDRARVPPEPKSGKDFSSSGRLRDKLARLNRLNLADKIRQLALDDEEYTQADLASKMVELFGLHVNLVKRTDAALLSFITSILPRQAPYVRSLRWNKTSMRRAGDRVKDGNAPFSPSEAKVITAAERLAGLPATFSRPTRRLRSHRLLVAEIVKRYPRLVKLDFVYDDLELNFPKNGWKTRFPIDHVLLAIISAGDRITDNNYSFSGYGREEGTADLSVLLTACPNLTRLRVSCEYTESGFEDSAEHNEVLASLPALTRLEYLYLLHFVEDDFPSIPSPIKHLVLNGAGPRSISGFQKLVSRYRDTLEELELYSSPWVEEDSPERHGPDFDLRHLKSLTFYTRAEQTTLIASPTRPLSPFTSSVRLGRPVPRSQPLSSSTRRHSAKLQTTLAVIALVPSRTTVSCRSQPATQASAERTEALTAVRFGRLVDFARSSFPHSSSQSVRCHSQLLAHPRNASATPKYTLSRGRARPLASLVQHDRSPASFASLPLELKSLIAEHVRANDEQGRRERARRPRTYSGGPDVNLELEREIRRLMGKEGAVRTDELVKTMVRCLHHARPSRTGLSALSLVNREWFSCCRPAMWSHLDLRSRTSKDVHFYLTTIAPRHADVVTTACFDALSNVARDSHSLDSSDWLGEEPHAEMQKRLVPAAEQLGDFFQSDDDDFSTRLFRVPGIFISEILKSCTNLRRINTGMTSSASLGVPSCPGDALRGLLASGATLSTLVYYVDASSDSSIQAYTALLAASTGLKSLGLYGTAGDQARMKDLWAAVCCLPGLVHLELSEFTPPRPEDLTVAWQVNSLSLDCTGGAPPTTLAPFFSLVSDTLTSLDYTYVVSGFGSDRTHDHPLPPSRPFSLPHLTDLVCNDEDAVETLPYFVNSPLRTLTLVPHRLSARRGAIKLIKGCHSTLRQVRLHGPQDGFYQGMPEDAAPVCAQHGIEYVEVVEGVEQKRR